VKKKEIAQVVQVQEPVLQPIEPYLQEGYYILFEKPITAKLANKLAFSLNGTTPHLRVMKQEWYEGTEFVGDDKETKDFTKNYSFIVLNVRRDYAHETPLEEQRKQEYEELIQQLKEDEKLVEDPTLAREFLNRLKLAYIRMGL